jgi:uncharacterized protein YciI
MFFVVSCIDHPDKEELRLATRSQHQDYIAASGGMVKAGGPYLDDKGETMIGTLIVLDVADRAAAEAWLRQDPYSKAGLFEQVEIRLWRWVVGVPAGA